MAKKQFLLITVVEREISTEFFPNFENAREEMKKQFMDCFNFHNEGTELDFEKNFCVDYEYEWGKTSAWLNDGPNHSNYDWKIIEISES